jgi:hypothetical protein
MTPPHVERRPCVIICLSIVPAVFLDVEIHFSQALLFHESHALSEDEGRVMCRDVSRHLRNARACACVKRHT